MKKQLCIVMPAVAVLSAALLSQTTQSGGLGKANFMPQQTEVYGESDGQYNLVLSVGPGAVQAISGRPFSATETSKTVQTLGDGTEITNSNSRMLYRDILGRVRTEYNNQDLVVIRDDVNGYTLRIFPEQKNVTRIMMAGKGGGRAGVAPELNVAIAPAPAMVARKKKAGEKQHETTEEDLGIDNINGVPAVGHRRTQIIPAGQIGNNRDIHVVYESWYSDDLQMLVKSVNSDPRYGVTTYELTNISRENPDPSLFQIPPGYSVTEGGRGGRGVGGGGVPGVVVPVPAKKNQ
ncbi:MAG TPA: hypothetical protein VML19_12340 [Verrucomicrobiae bacterium]|nr:hypothetical protein [Verrucomicrobiae bacterium]